MSFRIRVFVLVFAVLGLLLTGLGGWARTQLLRELGQAHQERIESEWLRARATLASLGRDLGSRVGAVARHLENDSAFRLALLGRNAEERRLLVDYAPQLWSLTGLDYLEILSADGHVLSSAHFRESHGAERRGVMLLLSEELSLARVPRAIGAPGLAWARAVRLRIGDTDYIVWGGVREDAISLPGARRVEDTVNGFALAWPGVDLLTGETSPERRSVSLSDEGLIRARRSLDRTILGAFGASLLAALFLSWVVARWIERPVRELIDKTLRVRVGREAVLFDTGRSDEIGELGRFIESMVRRLRDAAESLREAERRATLGDVARQVHHDVKNGVVPLRGVMRHLEEVAEKEPGRLAEVFRERAGTLESGLEYLEQLSTHYARLTQRTPLEPVDLRGLIVEMASSWSHAHSGVQVDPSMEPDLPAVQAETLGLRRVLDNLARNAAEAMETGGVARPLLQVSARRVEKQGRSWVEIEVRDNGPGLDEGARARLFEPFYTTKASGTGLGLSIVRRLVTDFGGRIDVESAPGVGTTFRLLLPAWAG